MNELNEMIKVADIHAQRMHIALGKLAGLVPFDAEKVRVFTEQDILLTDLLVNRFGKLQDFLGTKLIHAFLLSVGEVIDHLTMIDKINLLERLRIIDTADLWKEMRKARNHATHEYPDDPHLTAESLNHIMLLSPHLLNILENLKRAIDKR